MHGNPALESTTNLGGTSCHAMHLRRVAALCALRLAEIIVDAVLFERRVGGVAFAMTVASIFYFEFWFLLGVVLNAFLGAFWRPWWMLMASLGVFWGSFGGPLGDFLGSLVVLLAAVGCLGDPLGVSGASWDVPGRLGRDFQDFPGNSGRPFGSVFLLIFEAMLYRCCLGAFLEVFFSTVPSSRKMLHPTKVL